MSTNNFQKNKNDYTFFPNPSGGNVEYKGNELTINQIDIFDSIGRLVKQIKEIPTNNLDLNELKDENDDYKFKVEQIFKETGIVSD